MFFKKNQKNDYEKESSLYGKNGFENIIESAKSYTANKSADDKITILNYLIETLIADVCASTAAEPLFKYTDGMLADPFPTCCCDEKGNKIVLLYDDDILTDLSVNNIYVRPWNSDRTIKSILTLKDNDFIFNQYNHHSYYYTDINLCYVYNGNHFINAGRYYKKGIISSKRIDTVKLYPHCKTDGLYWYNSHTNKVLYKVSDFRLAAVYALAQMRYELFHNSHSPSGND